MNLPIETVQHVNSSEELGCRVTMMIGNELIEKVYPGCVAMYGQTLVEVFCYEDGIRSAPRVQWKLHYIIGIENFGDHAGQMKWCAFHNVPMPEPQVTVVNPAGPDYPTALPQAAVAPGEPSVDPLADSLARELAEHVPASHMGQPDPLTELAPESLDVTNGDVTKWTGTGTLTKPNPWKPEETDDPAKKGEPTQLMPPVPQDDEGVPEEAELPKRSSRAKKPASLARRSVASTSKGIATALLIVLAAFSTAQAQR